MQHFFGLSTEKCVKLDMQKNNTDAILHFLMTEIMNDKQFTSNPMIRARSAWIEAKRVYLKLTEEEKQTILRKIKK